MNNSLVGRILSRVMGLVLLALVLFVGWYWVQNLRENVSPAATPPPVAGEGVVVTRASVTPPASGIATDVFSGNYAWVETAQPHFGSSISGGLPVAFNLTVWFDHYQDSDEAWVMIDFVRADANDLLTDEPVLLFTPDQPLRFTSSVQLYEIEARGMLAPFSDDALRALQNGPVTLQARTWLVTFDDQMQVDDVISQQMGPDQTYTVDWSGTLTDDSEDNIQVLWLEDCDPRIAADFCGDYASLEPLNAFYQTLDDMGAALTYDLPDSFQHIAAYDVVIASFCGPAGNHYNLLMQYFLNGGSLIVMGDEFCLGVPPFGVSSGSMATTLTQEYDIFFGRADIGDQVWVDGFADHPITQGLDQIYAGRRAELVVRAGATVLASIGDEPFIALHDGTGTVIAIPRIGFHWEVTEAPNQNMQLWRQMIAWLAEQSAVKFNTGTPIPGPDLGLPATLLPPTPLPTSLPITPTPWDSGTVTPTPIPTPGGGMGGMTPTPAPLPTQMPFPTPTPYIDPNGRYVNPYQDYSIQLYTNDILWTGQRPSTDGVWVQDSALVTIEISDPVPTYLVISNLPTQAGSLADAVAEVNPCAAEQGQPEAVRLDSRDALQYTDTTCGPFGTTVIVMLREGMLFQVEVISPLPFEDLAAEVWARLDTLQVGD